MRRNRDVDFLLADLKQFSELYFDLIQFNQPHENSGRWEELFLWAATRNRDGYITWLKACRSEEGRALYHPTFEDFWDAFYDDAVSQWEHLEPEQRKEWLRIALDQKEQV